MTALPPRYRVIDRFPDHVRRVRSHMLVPVAVLILLLNPFPLQAASSTTPPDCRQQVDTWFKDLLQKHTNLRYPFKPATNSSLRLFAVEGSETLEARFNYRAKTIRTQVLAFTPGTALPAAYPFEAVVESSLRRSDNEPGFPATQVDARAAVDPNDGNVKINVCLNPQRPTYVQPGRYEGKIIVSGEGVEREAIPVTVTIQDPRWQLAALWAILGVILGLAVKILSDLQNTGASGTTAASHSLWGQVVDYSKKPRFAVSALLGIVWVLLAVVLSYVQNPTFGANIMDWVRLIGWGFAAEVSGMAGVDAVQYVTSKST